MAYTPNKPKSAAQRLLLAHVARTGQSISAIARATGLNLYALQKIQKGISQSVKPDTAAKLARHFGCTTEDVLGRPVAADGPSSDATPSGDSFPHQLARALVRDDTQARGGQQRVVDQITRDSARAAEAAGPAPYAQASDYRAIPYKALTRSTLNPRRPDTGNDAKQALQQLADDIAENGQLENLIVRPHVDARKGFEIVAGDRRYRAFGLLIKDGRRTADDTLACQVRALDDGQARAIAIVENLQRLNLTPSEEGDAFLALTEMGWETKDIAARIHKSLTFVQQRIATVRRATPELRRALDKGEINFDSARVTAAADPKKQAEIVAGIKSHDYRYRNADLIRQEITRHLTPAGFAIFPLADYKGETRDIDGVPYLVDRAAFDALQDKAVTAKKKELVDDGWSWVTIAEFVNRQDFEPEPSKNKKKAGCLIVRKHTGAVEIHEGLVEIIPSIPGAKEQQREENQFEKQAKAGERFIAALGEYVAKRPALALRLYVYQREQERALCPSFDEAPIVSWAVIAAAPEKELGRIVLPQIGFSPHRTADEAMLDLAKKAGIKVPAHMQRKENGAGDPGRPANPRPARAEARP